MWPPSGAVSSEEMLGSERCFGTCMTQRRLSCLVLRILGLAETQED